MSQKRFTDQRVGVLMGGLSSEREVSLKSGEAISTALVRLGYEQIPIDVDTNVALTLRHEHIDVAFIALHGRYGEDGCIQGLLEVMKIPYTGSKVAASATAMDKMRSHDVFKAHQLPSPATTVLSKKESADFQISQLPFGLPVVVKPIAEGSSLGVSIVKSADEMDRAFIHAFEFGSKILIQEYISGMEVNVGILDDRAIGAIEIKSKGEFYDYSAKYVPGMSTHIFPAPLPPDVYQNVLDLGLKAHKALRCSIYSRVDLLLDSEMQGYILEVNTLPGMTETSLMPEMARGCGIDFDGLVALILETACTAYGETS